MDYLENIKEWSENSEYALERIREMTEDFMKGAIFHVREYIDSFGVSTAVEIQYRPLPSELSEDFRKSSLFARNKIFSDTAFDKTVEQCRKILTNSGVFSDLMLPKKELIGDCFSNYMEWLYFGDLSMEVPMGLEAYQEEQPTHRYAVSFETYVEKSRGEVMCLIRVLSYKVKIDKSGAVSSNWTTLPSTGKLFYSDGTAVRLKPCDIRDFPV